MMQKENAPQLKTDGVGAERKRDPDQRSLNWPEITVALGIFLSIAWTIFLVWMGIDFLFFSSE